MVCSQAKKLRNLQSAFKLFNGMMRRPGKGDLTFLELQVWLLLAIPVTLCLILNNLCLSP